MQQTAVENENVLPTTQKQMYKPKSEKNNAYEFETQPNEITNYYKTKQASITRRCICSWQPAGL